jgi:hypothetical protein
VVATEEPAARATTTPPSPAFADSFTVPVEKPPPVTEFGDTVTEVKDWALATRERTVSRKTPTSLKSDCVLGMGNLFRNYSLEDDSQIPIRNVVLRSINAST